MFRFILWQSMLRSVAFPFSCVRGAHVLYVPHVGTFCNRSVSSYSILAYPFIS